MKLVKIIGLFLIAALCSLKAFAATDGGPSLQVLYRFSSMSPMVYMQNKAYTWPPDVQKTITNNEIPRYGTKLSDTLYRIDFVGEHGDEFSLDKISVYFDLVKGVQSVEGQVNLYYQFIGVITGDNYITLKQRIG